MNVFKKITLILSIACIASSASGMDSANWQLHTAARFDAAEEVTLLLDRGADIEYRDFMRHCTALHIAAENGCTKTIKVLVSKGANLEAIDGQESQTPLHKAVAYGHIGAARELLLAGAKTEARDLLDKTPLHVAALKDNGEMAKLLLNFGANKEATTGIERKTSLHIATAGNQKKVIKVLLDAGANQDAKDKYNRIPLLSALGWDAARGDLETIKMFLHHPQCALQSAKQASRQRILATLCFCNQNHWPKNVQLKLLSYMPEDVFNQEHARLLLNYGASIQALVAHCPLEWLVAIYHNTDQKYKEEFLKEIVAAVVEHRLCNVSQMVTDEQVVRVVRYNEQLVQALLNPNIVEQHREAIEQNVRAVFVDQEIEESNDLNNNNNNE